MKTTNNALVNSPTTSPGQASPPGNRSKGRVLAWLKRIALGLVAGIVVLALIGAAYQAIATATDARRYPAPGQMVDVSGYRLHIYCTGANTNGSPTVILESGLGATSSAWGWVQPEVAKATRVCAYDRAGMGWSDVSPEPRDALHIAKDSAHAAKQRSNPGTLCFCRLVVWRPVCARICRAVP